MRSSGALVSKRDAIPAMAAERGAARPAAKPLAFLSLTKTLNASGRCVAAALGRFGDSKQPFDCGRP